MISEMKALGTIALLPALLLAADWKVADSPLTTQWTAVQTDLKGGKTSTALSDLHTFAAAVRAQTGKKITTAASTTLLAYAQAVYKSQGGTGTV